MSRRTKLLITTLFLVLLAMPMAYVVLAWHPQNPLRFRQLDEKATYYAFPSPGGLVEKEYHSRMMMEVRNTSAATVLFISGHFIGDSSEGKEAFRAQWFAPPGHIEAHPIPPGGAIQVEFHSATVLATADLNLLQAGKLRLRDGVMRYQWGSHVQASTSGACIWLRERLPESLADHLPHMLPFEDTIDMDLPPPTNQKS
ncbi:hypothetical protein [Roseimicrobium sp. ORNL1]|uniref:hypothetical protein n=1 Tax=Roseimicrobium sp. ORNL1 TaxID=2711231 RepID=UPI0013E19936|nr:hypothetical protein [Roseimicrobium sp. ORNL1]QIF01987.1 hypothetical protein G5S37_10740 [Roseimicrobium sp. ORNL1]